MNKISTQKINIITLGCSKNLVDSEKLLGQLYLNKLDVAHESEDKSDYIVINTCGFIQDSKEESIDTILNSIEAKKAGIVKKIFVMGCLSERYREELQNEFSEIDGIFGVDEMEEIIAQIGVDYKCNLLDERFISTPDHYAYLKISEGCDRTCSFCAIPNIRGKHKSLPIEELVSEAEKLCNKGVKELILIAQDLTYYGIDIYGKKMLHKLIEELCKIEGIEWIRLHYAYPTQFPEKVLQLMKNDSKICHYLDIPLQHINDRILNSMKRGHTGETTRNLMNKFREYVPDISIRTTMIVGYPGETEEEFQELLDFVSEYKFDRLGAFTYSPEEDTPAYKLEDNIPEEVKIDRLNRLMDLQEQISLDKNIKKINKTLKVIIDRKEGDLYIGRTEYDSPEVDNEVVIESSEKLSIGDFYTAQIVDAEAFDLNAQIIQH